MGRGRGGTVCGAHRREGLAAEADGDGAIRQWHGETGYTTEAMLAKYVGDLTPPFYYVGGPPAMVSAMRETLGETGVDDDHMRTEEFSGYSEAEQG